MAAAAAAAIDGIGNENMIGSLAGDDTIFIVMRSEKLAMEFTENFRTTRGHVNSGIKGAASPAELSIWRAYCMYPGIAVI